MASVYKVRSLARDVSRCNGSNCKQRSSCARFKQIERDKERPDINHWGWTPYVDVLANTDECTIRIEEEI